MGNQDGEDKKYFIHKTGYFVANISIPVSECGISDLTSSKFRFLSLGKASSKLHF
jgi:hypothetical protein